MRMTIGVMAVLVRMIVQFIKKYLYVAVFIYVPYLFMAQFNPLIRDHERICGIVYVFYAVYDLRKPCQQYTACHG